MRLSPITLLAGFALLFVTSCQQSDIFDEVHPRKPELKEFASGLATPLGLALD